jgi:hypothetical protein
MHKISMTVAASLMLTSASFAANLITNGSFETGDLTGWTVDPFSLNNTQVQVYSGNYGFGAPAAPEQGTFAAAFGGGGSVTGEIAQEFATTPGAVYSGSLYYAGAGAPNDGYVQVTLGDATTLTPISISPQLQPAFNGTWSEYTFTFKATSALSGIDIVSPNGGGTDYLVDNVSIIAVPEPSPFVVICGLAAMGLFFVARRSRRQVA